MSRWLKLIAVLLLGAWMPATLHCGLAAMLDPATSPCCHDAQGSSPSSPHEADADNCRTVEDGAYQSIVASLKISAPGLFAQPWLAPRAIVPVSTETSEVTRPAAVPPLDLAPSWRFQLRVAQPARAPSSENS